jgi:hypothetical protein
VPQEVSERYPDADQELLRECRILVLAMVTAWRWIPATNFQTANKLQPSTPYAMAHRTCSRRRNARRLAAIERRAWPAPALATR